MSVLLQRSFLVGLSKNNNNNCRMITTTTSRCLSSSSSSSSSFAVIDHSKVYEESMEGRHGKQLQLAKLYGLGKDDPLFDPFPELDKKLQIHNTSTDDDSEFFADHIQEAEYTENNENENNNEAAEEEEEEMLNDEEGTMEDEDEDDDEENYYNNDGSLPYSKSQLVEFKAGLPSGGKFAIIALAGTQHKIAVNDVIVSHILKPLHKHPIGSIVEIKDILLMGTSHQTMVGMPFVTGGAVVKLMVEEITLDAKVIIFKKRRRKNSQRKNGFRRQVMMLRVLDIEFPTEEFDNHHVPRVEPKTDKKEPPSLLEELNLTTNDEKKEAA